MKSIQLLWTKCCLLLTMMCVSITMSAAHTFKAADGQFWLDGEKFVVKAAELHYMRIPHEYWDHRIKMCKALGMNTICIYVFWNAHEAKEGIFDFSGNRDLARFVSLCKENGMWVIVRTGPYVCAEWEMGGLPWWLLKNRDIKLRSLDERFMKPVSRFLGKVAEQLAPYRMENDGNILMVQVENEFGSFGVDIPYMTAIRDTLRKVGWESTPLFQCDWSSNFHQNALPDLIWTMNFGTGANVLNEFKKVREMRADTPRMCSEYWSGWFDGWGTEHQTRSADAMVNGISTMLENDISFSLYMTHGGTTFGHWAGANSPGFAPHCTSYDYDAPIDEQGAATEKYFKLRELLQKYSNKKLPAVPKPMKIIETPEVTFTECVPLLSADNMPQPISSYDAMPMEQYNQGYGSIMYSCSLPKVKEGDLLRITEVCDFAIVMVDGKIIGKLYRGNKAENTLRMPACNKGARLDIFIEAMGRINYSRNIHDTKGITDGVEILTTEGDHELTYNLKNWQVRLFPVEGWKEAVNGKSLSTASGYQLPAYYRSSFSLNKVGDTYLDMSTWGKGFVWVNGHNLGRFWEVGPQQTLFLPGCWLKKGRNEIVVLDILGPRQLTTKGLKQPNVTELHREYMPKDAVKVQRQKGKGRQSLDSGHGNDAGPGAK